MRLFVSLRPPAAALEHLRAQRPVWPGDPSRWHVTLAFLGDEGEPAPVAGALAAALDGQRCFPLALAGSGRSGDGPTWVGVDGDVDALHALAAVVRRATGVQDGRYRPHLTVGRRVDPRSLADYRGPTWTAQEVELVRSDLGREVVHTVARAPPAREIVSRANELTLVCPPRPTTPSPRRLRVAVVRFGRRMRAERADTALTLTQLSALTTLEQAGPMTPGELAAAEGVRPPSMTRVAASLEDALLITRTDHPTDGRQVLLAASPAARELLAEDRRRRDAWLASQLRGLDPADREVLHRAVEVLDRMAAS